MECDLKEGLNQENFPFLPALLTGRCLNQFCLMEQDGSLPNVLQGEGVGVKLASLVLEK